ncbi:hypothetical protein [Limosilactobacillus oris]|nr:hypothetical protein [Limosilactobacillus oris]MCW4388798.1 hypothetical protein [Limosilactobacillus oris]
MVGLHRYLDRVKNLNPGSVNVGFAFHFGADDLRRLFSAGVVVAAAVD